MAYFTGKGYGVSQYTDVSGVPLLAWTNPDTGKVITLFDRVAVQFDPTVKQVVSINQIYNARIDEPTSQAIKQAIGGTTAQELDHKISLELGGSNQLANLGLDTNTPGTSNNPTDTFENQLSAAVQAGAMSLLDAWRSMAQSKSFVLAEDLKVQTNSAWASAANGVVGILEGLFHTNSVGNIDTNLKAQIKQDADTLATTPNNLALRNKIFTEQINLTAQQLNLSKPDAAAYVKVYTTKYAQTKGIDPKELLGAFTANEQQLIGIAGATPNLLGIPNTVWANVSAAMTVGSTLFAVVGIIALLISIFTGGAADAVAAVGTAGVAGFLALLSSSTGIAISVGAFSIAAFLEGTALIIPMITKQMLDASVISPSLISTALNDDVKNIKALGGKSTSTSSSSSSSSSGSSSVGSISNVKVFSGVVSAGTLGSGVSFVARPDDLITSVQELQDAAQNNIAPFLAALPSKVTYELKVVPSVVTKDGLTQRGTAQKVQTGTHKNGTPIYKTITNKFATLALYVLDDKNVRHKITTIILGPTDSTQLAPTSNDIIALQNTIQQNATTTDLSSISNIKTNTPPTISPATPAVVTSATPTIASGKNENGDTLAPAQDPSFDFGHSLFGNPTLQPGYAWIYDTLGRAAQHLSVWTPPSGFSYTKPVSTAPVQSTPPAAKKATTLSDYYAALGQALPSVASRSQTYQALGLGQASMYTGTAEQNTKLLLALQG